MEDLEQWQCDDSAEARQFARPIWNQDGQGPARRKAHERLLEIIVRVRLGGVALRCPPPLNRNTGTTTTIQILSAFSKHNELHRLCRLPRP